MDPNASARHKQERIAKKFIKLVGVLRPALVCDIGSLNAADAREFRAASPSSRVIAFEANPYNYESTVQNDNPANHGIEFIHMAVAGHNGIATFHVVKYDRNSGQYDWRGGASSLRPKIDHELERIPVSCKKLDSYLAEVGVLDASKALWIDVEGAADVVLSGATRSLESTLFIKIEVEVQQHWEGQALDIDVIPLIEKAGFEIVDTSKTDCVSQYDVLAIKKELVALFGETGDLRSE